jgi:predicted Zn-dependent protease with MMP-like domain
MSEPPRLAPDLAEIERLAETALATIPAELRRHAANVVLRVEELCDEETMKELDLESPFELSGVYRGVDLLHDSVASVRTQPDMVVLYRRPILDEWCETGEDLYWLVRHIVIHEIGHHFGFSDDDMDELLRQEDGGDEHAA